MFPKPVSARLLSDESIDLPARLVAEDDVIQSMRRAAQFDQIGKISARRGEWYSYCLSPSGVRAGFIHRLSNAFCHSSVALPGFCSRYL